MQAYLTNGSLPPCPNRLNVDTNINHTVPQRISGREDVTSPCASTQAGNPTSFSSGRRSDREAREAEKGDRPKCSHPAENGKNSHNGGIEICVE